MIEELPAWIEKDPAVFEYKEKITIPLEVDLLLSPRKLLPKVKSTNED